MSIKSAMVLLAASGCRSGTGVDSTGTPLRITSAGCNCASGERNVAYWLDRKSTRLNSSHLVISYAVFCLKKKKQQQPICMNQRSRCYAVHPLLSPHTH